MVNDDNSPLCGIRDGKYKRGAYVWCCKNLFYNPILDTL
jgi:hypothetical protein